MKKIFLLMFSLLILTGCEPDMSKHKPAEERYVSPKVKEAADELPADE